MADDDDPNWAYNRAPVFKGGNHAYWKENMYVHLLSVDKNLWVIVTDGHFIPKDFDDTVKHLRIGQMIKPKIFNINWKRGTYLSQH